ncbi:MAG: hypothetical protein P4K93_11730 [Terracidiphilus sp.]|nr:hypothetical protein [Terracidiphilus sp.]MDR3798820.1 hypothetical protein [Terracidiphilus sp.]
MLMEEPYGIFGVLNPTGHNAVYFERICAETPVSLRRCQPGEMGVVIARYAGIDGYDWVAIPLLPYLYAVENAADVPAHVDRDTVERLRNHYRETHFESLGAHLRPGNFWHGGWTQLVGAAYERRIFAFRFQTSPEQDDALIRQLNGGSNQTRFNLLFNNCADFSRELLDHYFPRVFKRSFFPDAGMTTPKQTTYRLVRYARKHPETQLTVFEIPQIPGYRRGSHSAKDIDESLTTTVYAIPIAILNPYLAGGLVADYLVRGRYHLIPRHPQVLSPDNLSLLTADPSPAQNSASAGAERDTPSSAESGPGGDAGVPTASQPAGESNSGLQGIGARNE